MKTIKESQKSRMFLRLLNHLRVQKEKGVQLPPTFLKIISNNKFN
jgi:hypothetical protein